MIDILIHFSFFASSLSSKLHFDNHYGLNLREQKKYIPSGLRNETLF